MQIKCIHYSKKQKIKESDITNKYNKNNRILYVDTLFRNLRYAASLAFTVLVHGANLGAKVRLELPMCVRSAIVKCFPEESGRYTGFQFAEHD